MPDQEKRDGEQSKDSQPQGGGGGSTGGGGDKRPTGSGTGQALKGHNPEPGESTYRHRNEDTDQNLEERPDKGSEATQGAGTGRGQQDTPEPSRHSFKGGSAPAT